jgi:hypothetical protein
MMTERWCDGCRRKRPGDGFRKLAAGDRCGECVLKSIEAKARRAKVIENTGEKYCVSGSHYRPTSDFRPGDRVCKGCRVKAKKRRAEMRA